MKKIFVGSSTETLNQAKLIALELSTIDNVKPVLWTDVFTTGMLTLEAIEKCSRVMSGAVMIASPDDISVIRQKKIPSSKN